MVPQDSQVLLLTHKSPTLTEIPTHSALGAAKQSAAKQVTRGTLTDRIVAHVIDAIVVHGFSIYLAQIATLVFAWSLTHVYSVDPKQNMHTVLELVQRVSLAVWFASFFSVSFFYVVAFTHLFGRTLGKSFLGLRVIDQDTNVPPNLMQASARYFMYSLNYASFGLIFVVSYIIGKGTAVHDKLTRTRVVRDER